MSRSNSFSKIGSLTRLTEDERQAARDLLNQLSDIFPGASLRHLSLAVGYEMPTSLLNAQNERASGPSRAIWLRASLLAYAGPLATLAILKAIDDQVPPDLDYVFRHLATLWQNPLENQDKAQPVVPLESFQLAIANIKEALDLAKDMANQTQAMLTPPTKK